jgi:hypothetical protein
MTNSWALSLALLFFVAGMFCLEQQPRAQLTMMGAGIGGFGATFSPTCAQSTAFLARTSGLDTPHKAAYDTLICGLVSDGVYAQQDSLLVFAAQDVTSSLLDLTANAHNATAVNAPTFAANQGYTGNGTSSYIDTNYNPSVSSSGMSLNNTHGAVYFGTTQTTALVPGYGSNNSLFRMLVTGKPTMALQNRNDASNTLSFSDASAADNRLFASTRRDSTQFFLFINGASASSVAATSTTLSDEIYALASGTGPATFSNAQVRALSVGQQLSDAQALALYNRLHAYMQLIAGIP